LVNNSGTVPSLKEFTMISKFIATFEKFSESESVADLTDEARVALFGVYCQTMSQLQKPAAPPAKPAKTEPTKSRRRIRNPNRPATYKQLKLIAEMIEKGQLDDDVDTDNITILEASSLIDQGIKNGKRPKRAPAPAPRPEPEDEDEDEEFQGAYSHQSGGLASESNPLWG
jgi:hypothetical protein